MGYAGEGAMGDGSSRWLLSLGVAGSVLLAVVVGVVVYYQLVETAVSPSAREVASSQSTALQAFVPAAQLAGEWQDGAHLSAVSGHLAMVGMQPHRRVEWAFQFYAPATRQLALITVTDGAARMVREVLSPYAVPTFSAEEWLVDSDRALQTWWDRGGESLVAQRPDVDLVLQLRVPDGEAGQPVWTVAALMAESETAFTVVVNATDATVVTQ